MLLLSLWAAETMTEFRPSTTAASVPLLKMRLSLLQSNSSHIDVLDHILSIPAKPILLFSSRTDVQIELSLSDVKAYFILSALLSPKFEDFSSPQLSSASLYILLYISHSLFAMFNPYPEV